MKIRGFNQSKSVDSLFVLVCGQFKACFFCLSQIILKPDMEEDIRWKQRFQNYQKALIIMKNAMALAAERELSELEKQGVIKGFEFTFELAWNVMKDYLEEQGLTGIIGSKNAVRYAFNSGLIDDGQIWMDMIKDRNLAAHVYDEENACELFSAIKDRYCGHFVSFEEKMKNLQ